MALVVVPTAAAAVLLVIATTSIIAKPVAILMVAPGPVASVVGIPTSMMTTTSMTALVVAATIALIAMSALGMLWMENASTAVTSTGTSATIMVICALGMVTIVGHAVLTSMMTMSFVAASISIIGTSATVSL
jgi:hypothetical protein